jgi:hypothetical protein
VETEGFLCRIFKIDEKERPDDGIKADIEAIRESMKELPNGYRLIIALRQAEFVIWTGTSCDLQLHHLAFNLQIADVSGVSFSQ